MFQGDAALKTLALTGNRALNVSLAATTATSSIDTSAMSVSLGLDTTNMVAASTDLTIKGGTAVCRSAQQRHTGDHHVSRRTRTDHDEVALETVAWPRRPRLGCRAAQPAWASIPSFSEL